MARVRSDVLSLGAGWNDTLKWYAKGVRKLQSRPLADKTSWWFLAAIHGFHPTVWRQFDVVPANEPTPVAAIQRRFWLQCQHQSWYFLPWHRGYLAAFEEIMRTAIVSEGGPDTWALPYWNYSASSPGARTLPGAFDSPTFPDDGLTNPLRVERRYGSGVSPIQLDPNLVLLTALDDRDFKGGASDIPPGFGGPETLFHHGPESQTTNGGVESLPHNVIHGALGGSAPGENPNDWRNFGLMSMPMTAALDPIFWLHHANIDRLWNVWLRNPRHKNPEETTWLDGPAERPFAMPKSDGGEWQFTARDVLDTTASPLDYQYDDETPPVIERRVVRRLRRLGVRGAALSGAEEGGEAAVSTEQTPELIGASDGAVRVAGTTSTAVRLDAPATESLHTSLARAAAAGGRAAAEPARVFLKLEGIRGTSDAAIYHVYIDVPPNADPAEYADRRAGTVSLFGVSAASNPDGPSAGSGINQVLEISEIVDALHLSGDALERLEVRFVPVNETVAGADFSIGRLSVFKLGQ
jgi:tyrosinase